MVKSLPAYQKRALNGYAYSISRYGNKKLSRGAITAVNKMRFMHSINEPEAKIVVADFVASSQNCLVPEVIRLRLELVTLLAGGK